MELSSYLNQLIKVLLQTVHFVKFPQKHVIAFSTKLKGNSPETEYLHFPQHLKVNKTGSILIRMTWDNYSHKVLKQLNLMTNLWQAAF